MLFEGEEVFSRRARNSSSSQTLLLGSSDSFEGLAILKLKLKNTRAKSNTSTEKIQVKQTPTLRLLLLFDAPKAVLSPHQPGNNARSLSIEQHPRGNGVVVGCRGIERIVFLFRLNRAVYHHLHPPSFTEMVRCDAAAADRFYIIHRVHQVRNITHTTRPEISY